MVLSEREEGGTKAPQDSSLISSFRVSAVRNI